MGARIRRSRRDSQLASVKSRSSFKTAMINFHEGPKWAFSGFRMAARSSKVVGVVAGLISLAGVSIPAAQGADLAAPPPQMAEPAVPVDTGWTFELIPYGSLASV